MLTKSKIGVCLDYSIAYLLEEKNEEKVITIIESEEEDVEDNMTNEDSGIIHHRKDHAYFKKVFDMVKDFDKIMLFGPASVKNEILKRIKANKLLHIEVQNNPNKDMVTDNEKFEFINSYFGN